MRRTLRMRGGTALMPNGSITPGNPTGDGGVNYMKQTEEQKRARELQMRNIVPVFGTPIQYEKINFPQEDVIKRILDKPVSSYETSVDVDEAMKIITSLLTPPRSVKIMARPASAPTSILAGGSSVAVATKKSMPAKRPPPVPSIGISSLDGGITQLTQLATRYAPTTFDAALKKLDDFLTVQQKLVETIQDRIEEIKTKDIQSRQALIAKAKVSKGSVERARDISKKTGDLIAETLTRLTKYKVDLGTRLNELREKFTELQKKEAEEAAAAAVEEAVEEEEGENSNQEGGGKRRSKTRVARRARTLVRKYMKQLRHGRTLRK